VNALRIEPEATGPFISVKGLTVVKDLKKEPGPGLLADMCKQLGIRNEDL